MAKTKPVRMTLWEKLTKGKEPPPPPAEDGVWNPAKLHFGDFVTRDLPPDEDADFTVIALAEHKRSGTDPFIDYYLDSEGELRILRAIPKAAGAADLDECSLLWLKVYHECGFDENIVGYAKQKEFICYDDDGKEEQKFFANNEAVDGFAASVRGLARNQAPETRKIRYWDFSRKGMPKKFDDELKGDIILFFVELDETTGVIRMLIGRIDTAASLRFLRASRG